MKKLILKMPRIESRMLKKITLMIKLRKMKKK